MKGGLFSDVFVAIDVGTTKICVLVARHMGDSFEIIGIGKSPSHGLKKGMVVDITKTVQSIKQAVAEAQLMAGCTIESAIIGISGSHIKSFTSHGIVPIKRGEITQNDVDNVLASARAVSVPEDQQILHVLPQYYVIDGQDRVYEPLGMFGIRLEAYVHIITGSIASVQNLIKCCEMAGVKVTDIVLEQLASAAAVLSPDERQLGVGIVDIGGGTSDIAIYQNGAIKFTAVIPIAGNQFTSDVAIGLRTTITEAERVKKEFGTIFVTEEQKEGYFELAGLDGEKQVAFIDQLVSIIRPRGQELLTLVQHTVVKNNLSPFITAGFVLTGGGSLLTGFPIAAQQILKVPIRLGKPRLQSMLLPSLEHPMYATGYGLLLCGMKKRDTATVDSLTLSGIGKIMTRMKSWISDFF